MYRVRLFVCALSLMAMASAQDEKFALRVFEECTASGVDTTSCLKLKIVNALDRATRSRDLEIFDGVHLIASDVESTSPASENEIESSLPRSLDDRDAALDDLIAGRISKFFQTRSVQFKLSGMTDESARGMDEGRKKKRGNALLMYMLMSLGSIIPLKLGTLALLAGKALIISKLALALAAIVGLKKLMSGHEHEGSSRTYQVIHADHEHQKRSIDADLPYRAYVPKQ